jgi:hypothetical protein
MADGRRRRGAVDVMAYKFLRPGAVGPFSGFRWPLPTGDAAGEWVRAEDPLRACVAGVHAAPVTALPYWIAEELWMAELDEPLVDEGRMLVAARGRLVARIGAWTAATARTFGEHCARRAREIVEEGRGALRSPEDATALAGYAVDAARFARRGSAGVAAYVAAHAAGCAAARGRGEGRAYRAGADAERADQARFLAALLDLEG